MEGTATELMGVFVFYIKQHSQPHTTKVSNRLCDTHKEVRHDFRLPQEEACHLFCDVPALSSEKGVEKNISDRTLYAETSSDT